MKLIKKSGFSLAENMITLTITGFSFLVFTGTMYSVQKSNSIIDKNIQIRETSNVAKSNIERVLRNGFYFFCYENAFLPTGKPLPAILDNNSIFKTLQNLPTGADISNQSTAPGNVLYFLTQEIIPLKELVNPNMTISQSSIVSALSGSLISLLPSSSYSTLVSAILSPTSNKLPSYLLDSKIRVVKLNLLYLEKAKYDSNNPFDKNTYNLVHAVSNYPIYHKTADNKSADSEGSIVWSEDTILDKDENHALKDVINTTFKVAGSTTDSVNNYLNVSRTIIYKALENANFVAWNKPEDNGNSAAYIPAPISNASSPNNYTKRIIARNIGIKEAVGVKPIVNLIDPTDPNINNDLNKSINDLPTSLRTSLNQKYPNYSEWYGASFKYINQKYTPIDESTGLPDEDPANQKASKVIEVTLNISKYDPSSKQIVTARNVFKVVPRNLLKRSM